MLNTTYFIVNIYTLYYLIIFLCSSEYSMQLNASRIKVLQAQDDLVNAMKEAASQELLKVSHHDSHHHLHHHHDYQGLMKALVVQVKRP